MGRARRGRGEGSIFQRKDGLWAATLNLGYDSNGTRKRRTVYGQTKQEVRDKLTRLQSDSINNVLAEPNRITLAQFLKRWLEDAARPTIRPATYISYERLIRLHINPHLGGVALAKLTPAHVQNLYSSLEQKGASARLRQQVHAVLHVAFKQALKWGNLHRNICDSVNKPRVTKRPMQVLTAAEADRLLKCAKDDRLYALYVQAITTGMRQGELLGLHWSDVDLESGHVSVQYTLSEVNGSLNRTEPKTAKSRRLIDLPSMAVTALKEHRKRMLAEGHPGPWVFSGTSGQPLWKSNLIYHSFKPLLAKANLPNIRFHDLRHTAATLLLAEGINPKIVQERLGHSQISLTLDTYSHVLPTMQREAASRLDKLFQSF